MFVGQVGLLAILLIYKPKKRIRHERAAVQAKYRELGSWIMRQKATVTVLLCCLVLWMTEQLHGISAGTVNIVAAVLIVLDFISAAGRFTASSFYSSVTPA